MIQNSWSKLEADALESYEFRLAGDPRAEWVIGRGKVDRNDLIGIVQYYKYESEKLPCCLCGRAVHHGGAVVQLRDFSFRLVGQCCGKNHFKDSWSEHSNAFRSAERSAGHRIKARKILAEEEALTYACFSLRIPIDLQESARRALKAGFEESFPPLVRELLRSAGRLSYGEIIGTTLADQGGRAGLKTIQRDTAPLAGVCMFSLLDKRKALENTISSLLANLRQMREALDGGKSLYPCIRKHDDLIDKMQAIVEDYHASCAYLHEPNAQIISFWFEKTGINKTVEIKTNGWRVTSPTAIRMINWTSLPKLICPRALCRSDV